MIYCWYIVSSWAEASKERPNHGHAYGVLHLPVNTFAEANHGIKIFEGQFLLIRPFSLLFLHKCIHSCEWLVLFFSH